MRLAVILSALCGIGCFFGTQYALKEGGWSAKATQAVHSNPLHPFGVDIPGLDFVLHLLLLFFMDCITNPANSFVFYTLFTYATGVIVTTIIDSGRRTKYIYGLPLILYASQFIGISFIIPTFFVPMWRYSIDNAKKVSDAPDMLRIILSWLAVLITAACLIAFPFVSSSLSPTYIAVGTIMLIAPITIPCFASFWCPKQPSQQTDKRARSNLHTLYAFWAGVCLIVHWLLLAHITAHYCFPPKVAVASTTTLEKLLKHTPPPVKLPPIELLAQNIIANPPSLFLVIDLIGLFFSCSLCMVQTDYGVLGALISLICSVILSPGTAYCLYMIKREYQFRSLSSPAPVKQD